MLKMNHEMYFFFRIVEGLLTVAEINFIFDKPDACQIKLLEAEKILDEVICDKVF